VHIARRTLHGAKAAGADVRNERRVPRRCPRRRRVPSPAHICAGTGLTPATSAPGLRRDLAHPCPHPNRGPGPLPAYIFAGTGLAPPLHICTGTAWAHPGPLLRRDSLGSPLPHLRRDCAGSTTACCACASASSIGPAGGEAAALHRSSERGKGAPGSRPPSLSPGADVGQVPMAESPRRCQKSVSPVLLQNVCRPCSA
jgi:hypothetical protein